MQSGSDGCWVNGWFASQLRSLKHKEPATFTTMSCKQTCLSLFPEGSIIFIILDSKQTRPLLHRKMLSLPSKAVYVTNIPEKTVPLLTRCTEKSDTNGELSPNSLTLTEAADSENHALHCSSPPPTGVTPGDSRKAKCESKSYSSLEIVQVWECLPAPRTTCWC